MNVYRDSVIPFTQFGGISMSSEFPNFNGEENWLTIFVGEGGFSKQTSMPDGNYSPVAWKMPLKSGAITSRYNINGSSILVYNGVLGYPIGASFSGTGTLDDAEGSLLAFLIADIIGSGEFDGSTVGGLLMLATLSGVSDIVFNLLDGITREDIITEILGVGSLAPNISGGIYAVSGFSGIANLEEALGALAGAICDIITSGEFNSTPSGRGFISANITPFTELSPEGLAASVWNTVAATYNSAGSMGSKVNSSASAGDPWAAILPGTYISGTAGKIISDLANNQSITQEQIADAVKQILQSQLNSIQYTGEDNQALIIAGL